VIGGSTRKITLPEDIEGTHKVVRSSIFFVFKEISANILVSLFQIFGLSAVFLTSVPLGGIFPPAEKEFIVRDAIS